MKCVFTKSTFISLFSTVCHFVTSKDLSSFQLDTTFIAFVHLTETFVLVDFFLVVFFPRWIGKCLRTKITGKIPLSCVVVFHMMFRRFKSLGSFSTNWTCMFEQIFSVMTENVAFQLTSTPQPRFAHWAYKFGIQTMLLVMVSFQIFLEVYCKEHSSHLKTIFLALCFRLLCLFKYLFVSV